MLNKLAAFCYAFIAGVAAATHFSGNLGCWSFWTVLAGAFVVCELLLELLRIRFDRLAPLTFVIVILAGLTGGVARRIANDSRPDFDAAKVIVDSGSVYVDGSCVWPEASRLKIRKDSAGGAVLVLDGVLESRVPVLDNDGNPSLNEDGLWRFIITNTPASATIVLPDETIPGSEVDVPAAFSAVTNISLAADSGVTGGVTATVVRVSSHVETFASSGQNIPYSTLLGRISDDPSIYASRAVLTVEPYFIQREPNGPFFRVSGGNVRVNVDNDVEDYEQISVKNAYGNDIIAYGQLQLPQTASNPGGFDNRAFLNRSGIFAQMSIWPPKKDKNPNSLFQDSSFTIVAPGGSGNEPRHGNLLIMSSLALREKMLGVIKETVPHPVSAFIGGVTLGLRYGLQGTECVLSPDAAQKGGKKILAHCGSCSEFISEEFRRSGVNHVLAVSGLHVTIISVMLMGLFSLIKIPRKVYAPVIIFALVVFSIITGARPSTLRAVIMNSLFLLSWSYLDQSLKSSVLIGIPVAAFIILLQSPALLVDPSFTLSFGAILSLALLTEPCLEALSLFKGNDFITLFLVTIGFHAIAIYDWMLFTSPVFLSASALVVAILFVLGRGFKKIHFTPVKEFGFGSLPVSVSGFLAAQMAIQLGMMIPLSSYYFSRWPVAGAVANLIAIPLIGIVLQLAMMACIIGLIPIVGLWVALVLNAGNWLMSMIFLLSAHFMSDVFPYPFVCRIGGTALFVYYVALALFVWHEPISSWIELRLRVKPLYSLIAAVAILTLALWYVLPVPAGGDGKTHIDFISVNYGSSVLIRSPGGKRILVDAGYTSGENTRFSQAERNVVPYLTKLGIRRLDAVAALSGRAERISGIPFVLKHCNAETLILPPSLESIVTVSGRVDSVALDLIYKPENCKTNPIFGEARDSLLRSISSVKSWISLDDVLRGRGTNAFNRLTGRAVAVKFGREGETLFREDTPNGEFGLEIFSGTGKSPLGNGSMMLRVYHGDFSMLLTGDVGYSQFDGLTNRVPHANILVMPNHGQNRPEWLKPWWKSFDEKYAEVMCEDFAPYVRESGVKAVVFEYGNPRSVLKDSRSCWKLNNAARRYCRSLGLEVYGTDTDGPVSFVTDGIDISRR